MDGVGERMSERLTKDLVVKNAHGLHARTAALLVKTANGFKSEVLFQKDGQSVNGKSIMGVLMLAAGQGSIIRVIVEGEDSIAALAAIEALFLTGFNEGS
jgi:phosphocarrier protein HPr